MVKQGETAVCGEKGTYSTVQVTALNAIYPLDKSKRFSTVRSVYSKVNVLISTHSISIFLMQ